MAATEFHVVDVKDHRPLVDMGVVARRTQRTLEGRLARTPFARTWPTLAAILVLISAGEAATVIPWLGAGPAMGLHALALILMGTHAPLVRRLNAPLARLEVGLLPVPLLRIVSLTSSQASFTNIEWLAVIGVLMYAGIVFAVRLLKPSFASLGLRLPARKHLPLEVGIALFGFVLGWMEWHILHPGLFVVRVHPVDLTVAVVVIFVSTGLLEELLFRGILQRYATLAVGWVPAVLFVSFLFAVLHAGWQSWTDILFVGSVGLLYSLVRQRTGSLLGITVSHGITNSMLFLIMPLLMA